MNASVEISMYPLIPDYETPIINFIERLNENEKLTVKTNAMSTQIVGDYDEIMTTLTKEIKAAFLNDKAVVMVLKIINIDLTN